MDYCCELNLGLLLSHSLYHALSPAILHCKMEYTAPCNGVLPECILLRRFISDGRAVRVGTEWCNVAERHVGGLKCISHLSHW